MHNINISNYDNVIDSRDVIGRIAELEDIAEDRDLDGDEHAELRVLTELAREGAAATVEWEHGTALVRHSYLVDYARELADDLGLPSEDTRWPLTHIDWERAADELRTDHTEITFDGVTYWVHY